MLRLPDDILHYVASFLTVPERTILAAACKYFKKISLPKNFFPAEYLLETSLRCTSDKQAEYFFPPLRRIQWIFNSTGFLLEILAKSTRGIAFFQYLFRTFFFSRQSIGDCVSLLNKCPAESHAELLQIFLKKQTALQHKYLNI